MSGVVEDVDAGVRSTQPAAAQVAGDADGGTALSTRDLRFSYGNVPVLFGVTIDIPWGEIVAIVGPNGAGKTTLLRVIAGLERQDSGTVRFAGAPLDDVRPEQRVRDGLVSVFAGQAVFPDLSVEENLRVGGQLIRADRPRLESAIDAGYRLFPRLAERRGSLGAQLSGGEQQMLALAKALVLEPRVLCIDELSLGLAPTVVERLVAVLDEFRSSGGTVVLIEQHVSVAALVADRAIVFERGTAVRTVRGDQLTDEGLVRAAFLGEVFT